MTLRVSLMGLCALLLLSGMASIAATASAAPDGSVAPRQAALEGPSQDV